MKLHKRDIPFTMVANEVLYRTDLSLKAKGLFAYLFSKPEGWDFAGERIAKECKEERKSILNTLKELEEIGLIKRERQSNGRMDYTIEYATQSTKSGLRDTEPKSQNGTEANRHGGESGLVSNKENIINKDRESNTSEAGASQEKHNPLGADILKAFEAVDPKNKEYYENITQRKACDFLIKTYSFDEVIKRVQVLPKTNKVKYLPHITTPVQLRDKWVDLQDGVDKMRRERVTNKPKMI